MSRASYGDVLAYADRALVSENGVSVELADTRTAINMRMRFYAKRKERQARLDDSYDSLICLQIGNTVTFKKIGMHVEVTSL